MPDGNSLLAAALVVILTQLLQLVLNSRNKSGLSKVVESGLEQVREHVDRAAGIAPPETKETNSIVKEMLASLQAGQKGWELAVNMLTSSTDNLTRQLVDLKTENGALRTRLDTYVTENDKLLKDNAASARRTSEQLGVLETQVGVLNQQAQAARQDLQTVRDDLIASNEKLVKTQAELDAARAQLAEQQQKLDDAQRRIADLESQRVTEAQAAADEKQKLELALDTEREKVTILQAQITEQQRQIEALETEVAYLRSELDAAKKPPEPKL